MKKKPTKQQLEDLCEHMLAVLEAVIDPGVNAKLSNISLEQERLGNLAIISPVVDEAHKLGIISRDSK